MDRPDNGPAGDRQLTATSPADRQHRRDLSRFIDSRRAFCLYGCVAETDTHPQTITVALCIDSEAVDRLGRVLRNLVIGLVDQAVVVRIISADPRVETLSLGPVQVIRHQPLTWPMRRTRIFQLLDVLAHQPPSVVHAVSAGSYGLAWQIADELDIDLVCQVSSAEDCRHLADFDLDFVGRFLPMTEPFQQALNAQLKVTADRITIQRPGMPVSAEAACFGKPGRAPTILCTSPFEKKCGVDRLIVALALVRKQIPAPPTFLLGRGSAESSLRRMVRERELASAVVFAQPLGDSDAAMESADIFIRPVEDDSVRSDVLQAMGAGSLVVTLPSENVDYLRHEQTALICRQPTAQALAEGIVQAIRDPRAARAIAKGGMEHVRVHHGVSAMAETAAGAYRDLVLTSATFALHR